VNDLDKFANKINAQVRGFYLEGDVVVKAIRYLRRENKVLFVRLDTGDEYFDEYKGSALFRKRIFTIGEVAKLVGRKAGTVREYERIGLLPPASRFEYKGVRYRYYNYSDVRDLESFFSSRKVGRPAKSTVHSASALKKRIREAKKGIR